MSMRCKFILNAVIPNAWGNGVKAIFGTQYDNTIPEDIAFSKATPNGNIDVTIDNPSAISRLIMGKAYYVDITPVE